MLRVNRPRIIAPFPESEESSNDVCHYCGPDDLRLEFCSRKIQTFVNDVGLEGSTHLRVDGDEDIWILMSIKGVGDHESLVDLDISKEIQEKHVFSVSFQFLLLQYFESQERRIFAFGLARNS